jgi:multicomponent Na+:H+ antiporter subunit D
MPFYVLVLLVSSLLNALYYLPIIVPAFFGGLDSDHHHGFKMNEATPRMLVPIAILALSTLIFGLLPTNIPFDLSRLTAVFLMRGGTF